MIKLIDEELKRRFKEVWEQILEKKVLVLARFYAPWNDWSWYVAEYYPEHKVCYGFVSHEDRRAYFSLVQIEDIQWPYWVQIQRDTCFGECFFDVGKS